MSNAVPAQHSGGMQFGILQKVIPSSKTVEEEFIFSICDFFYDLIILLIFI